MDGDAVSRKRWAIGFFLFALAALVWSVATSSREPVMPTMPAGEHARTADEPERL